MNQEKLNALAAYLSEQIDIDDDDSTAITDLELTVEELVWILDRVYDEIDGPEDED